MCEDVFDECNSNFSVSLLFMIQCEPWKLTMCNALGCVCCRILYALAKESHTNKHVRLNETTFFPPENGEMEMSRVYTYMYHTPV